MQYQGSCHCGKIAFTVEGICHDGTGPMPTHAFRGCITMAYASGRGQLTLRRVAREDLANFEQRHVRNAAVDIGLNGRDETGQQARPHVGHIGRDRISER